jgi:hypothetical protein
MVPDHSIGQKKTKWSVTKNVFIVPALSIGKKLREIKQSWKVHQAAVGILLVE